MPERTHPKDDEDDAGDKEELGEHAHSPGCRTLSDGRAEAEEALARHHSHSKADPSEDWVFVHCLEGDNGGHIAQAATRGHKGAGGWTSPAREGAEKRLGTNVTDQTPSAS